MRSIAVIMIGNLLAGFMAYADVQVAIGASRAEVIESLGQPEGVLRMGGIEWLSYSRGTVKLERDRVIEAELVSVAEGDARRSARIAARQAHADAIARHTQHGMDIKAARLSDPDFLSLPAVTQADYWRSFHATYPGVPVDMEYQLAVARAEQEYNLRLEYQTQEQRMNELEMRLADAEWNARHTQVIYTSPYRYHYWNGPICRERPHIIQPSPLPVVPKAPVIGIDKVFTFGKQVTGYNVVSRGSQ